LDLGAMPNPNKVDEFNQWPRYALCDGHFMLHVTNLRQSYESIAAYLSAEAKIFW